MDVGVPIGNQRAEKGADGRAPEDGNMDCVPECLAKMIQALTGRYVTGDELHDAVYGEGYVGLQDPARFAALLAQRYGVRLSGPIVGSAQALYGRACAEIAAGRPVLLSIPSDWDNEPPRSQYAHMVAGCDVLNNGAQLTAMNPWTAGYQTETAAWWQERFDRGAYKALWYMERIGVTVAVPTNWHWDGKTLTAANGVATNGWIAEHIIQAVPQWPAELVPVAPMYSVQGGGWQEEFAASKSLVCTATGVVTEKAGPDYVGQLAAARRQIEQLEAEVAQLKAGGSGGNGGNPAYKAAVDALKVALAAE